MKINLDSQEKKLLRYIKLSPIIFGALFFIFGISLIVRYYYLEEIDDIKNIKKRLIETKKNFAKSKVETIIDIIQSKRNEIIPDIYKNLKNRVDEAHTIAMSIYKNNKDKSESFVKRLIKDALRDIRFNNNRGYYFIYDVNSYKNILLPIAPELEGKSFENYKDINGKFIVKEFADICKKQGGGYNEWYWRKPDNNRVDFKKIGYSRLFEPYDWFIGTGEYITDYENIVKKKLLKRVGNIEYKESGNIFILNYNGIILSRNDKTIIGKNRLKLQDANGDFVVKKIIDTAKKGDGFIEYVVNIHSSTKNEDKKIFYVKGFDKWGWAIGSEICYDDINREISNKIEQFKKNITTTLIKLTFIITVIAVILFWISLKFSKMMERIFISYKENLISVEDESKKRLLAIEYQNKFTALGEMIGNISHQWKQPLNALNISVSKLRFLAHKKKLDTLMLDKSLSRMEKNISFLSRTIDLFRDFFKRDSVCEAFELNELIENILFIVQASFTTKDIDIVANLDEKIIIYGDRLKLEQAILNILNNAKDALLINKISYPKIVIETKKSKKFAKIEILDNGGGIKPEIIDKVFDLYFTTKDKLDGTGFGLYLVKTIIENDFNGDIWCRNSENGAVFTIKIPIYMQ